MQRSDSEQVSSLGYVLGKYVIKYSAYSVIHSWFKRHVKDVYEEIKNHECICRMILHILSAILSQYYYLHITHAICTTWVIMYYVTTSNMLHMLF